MRVLPNIPNPFKDYYNQLVGNRESSRRYGFKPSAPFSNIENKTHTLPYQGQDDNAVSTHFLRLQQSLDNHLRTLMGDNFIDPNLELSNPPEVATKIAVIRASENLNSSKKNDAEDTLLRYLTAKEIASRQPYTMQDNPRVIAGKTADEPEAFNEIIDAQIEAINNEAILGGRDIRNRGAAVTGMLNYYADLLNEATEFTTNKLTNSKDELLTKTDEIIQSCNTHLELLTGLGNTIKQQEDEFDLLQLNISGEKDESKRSESQTLLHNAFKWQIKHDKQEAILKELDRQKQLIEANLANLTATSEVTHGRKLQVALDKINANITNVEEQLQDHENEPESNDVAHVNSIPELKRLFDDGHRKVKDRLPNYAKTSVRKLMLSDRNGSDSNYQEVKDNLTNLQNQVEHVNSDSITPQQMQDFRTELNNATRVAEQDFTDADMADLTPTTPTHRKVSDILNSVREELNDPFNVNGIPTLDPKAYDVVALKAVEDLHAIDQQINADLNQLQEIEKQLICNPALDPNYKEEVDLLVKRLNDNMATNAKLQDRLQNILPTHKDCEEYTAKTKKLQEALLHYKISESIRQAFKDKFGLEFKRPTAKKIKIRQYDQDLTEQLKAPRKAMMYVPEDPNKKPPKMVAKEILGKDGKPLDLPEEALEQARAEFELEHNIKVKKSETKDTITYTVPGHLYEAWIKHLQEKAEEYKNKLNDDLGTGQDASVTLSEGNSNAPDNENNNAPNVGVEIEEQDNHRGFGPGN